MKVWPPDRGLGEFSAPSGRTSPSTVWSAASEAAPATTAASSAVCSSERGRFAANSLKLLKYRSSC